MDNLVFSNLRHKYLKIYELSTTKLLKNFRDYGIFRKNFNAYKKIL